MNQAVKKIVKKRATDSDEKALRKQQILNAAASLYVKSPDKLPSVISIAKEAGLAKGTLYIYFKTKEEIFQALLENQFAELLTALESALMNQGAQVNEAGQPNGLGSNKQSMEKQQFVGLFKQTLVAYIDTHPHFLPLASMANTVIEQNLGQQQCKEFKLFLARSVEEVGAKIDLLLGLPSGEGAKRTVRTHATLIGLWQMLNWPKQLEAFLDQPEFKIFKIEFEHELEQMLKGVWLID